MKATYLVLAALLAVFVMDYFVFVPAGTEILSFSHFVYGEEPGALTDCGRLL